VARAAQLGGLVPTASAQSEHVRPAGAFVMVVGSDHDGGASDGNGPAKEIAGLGVGPAQNGSLTPAVGPLRVNVGLATGRRGLANHGDSPAYGHRRPEPGTGRQA
jgi:hypothetical protein